MSSTNVFWGLGDLLESMLVIYDENIGFTTTFNTLVLLGGFFGLFYWLRHQLRYNEEAKNNPNQLK